eukprot:6999521-Alexandrium_andersonii.AAC.1
MSASLVGSEMCIRDRRPPPRGMTKVSRWSPALSQRRGRAPSCSGRHSTVSYTHLTLPTICSV